MAMVTHYALTGSGYQHPSVVSRTSLGNLSCSRNVFKLEQRNELRVSLPG